MSMNKDNLIKAGIIFGGGLLLFLAFKPKNGETAKKSFDSQDDDKNVQPTPEQLQNAEIVADAYASALKAGEPPAKLTELNKECMKEFGLRCYVEKGSGSLVVCNTGGQTIMTR